jgi:hypothetical protein
MARRVLSPLGSPVGKVSFAGSQSGVNGWRRPLSARPKEKFATDESFPYEMVREFSEDGRAGGLRQDPVTPVPTPTLFL